MNVFTIKDVELLTNIKAHTIRIWEQRYSFLKPKRTPTNIRYYSPEELRSILNISLLNKNGIKISEIDQMDESAIGGHVVSLNYPTAREDRIFNELVMMAINMQGEEFEKLINRYIDEEGIDKAITALVVPFIDRIGIFWLNRNDDGAGQKLISNILRQKFLYAISTLQVTLQKNKSIILFLPEDEHYELGLLHLAYLVRQMGMVTIYLGANLPLVDLLSITKFKSPHCIVTHLNSRNPSFEKFLPKYQQQFTDIPLLVATHSTRSIFKKPPPSAVKEMHFSNIPTILNSI